MKQNIRLQSILIAITLLLFIGSCKTSTQKPNVILIYTDDVGFGDVGVYGSKLIPTPNIDRLTMSGIRFTNAYSAAATCTPSRYSLLTGELAFRNSKASILQGDASMLIKQDQYTLGDLFKEAGYETAIIGKWHLGLGTDTIDWNGKIEGSPNDLGFDYSYIIPATNDRVPCVYIENGRVVNLDSEDPITVSYRKRIHKDVPGTVYPDALLEPNSLTLYKADRQHSCSVINGVGRIGYMRGGKRAVWSDENMAFDLVEKVNDYISNRSKPFFLCFTTSDIHAPRIPHSGFKGATDLGYRGDNMVQLDWCVGEVMAMLKRERIEENTIVIFTSDNGPIYKDGGYEDGCEDMMSETDRGHDASGLLKGGKYRISEGGTRVPFIVSWKNRIESGVSTALLSQTDLFASFAAMLKLNLKPNVAPDSRNVWSLLSGVDSMGVDFVIQQATGLKPGLAIRHGDWKLIELHPPGTWGKPFERREIVGYELYNLNNDPSEENDLLAVEAKKAFELKGILEKVKKNYLTKL